MEIDPPELMEEGAILQGQTQAQIETAGKVEGKKPNPVIVDDAHPFDLDAYISSYSGRLAVYRLLHIIERCPTLALQAFQVADQRIRAGRDIKSYELAVNLVNAHFASENASEVLLPLDEKWIQETNTRNITERNKLEVELKTYSNNMIKESIRMAHRDLGNFYRSVGDEATSLKHYTKSREFCTTSLHVLEMCISVLELLIEQRNYSHIITYVFKADAALDSTSGSHASAGAPAAQAPQQLHKKQSAAVNAEREKVQTKLDVATGLAHLGQANYEKAAATFLKLGPPKGLEDWNGKIITPSDIAIYGTLCALATLSRGAINVQVVQNETFGDYLEQEPYARELIDAYISSRFRTVLEVLDRYSSRHALDIHLSSHIHDLTTLIRDRALVLYFQPFTSVRFSKIASAFGLPESEVEQLVVGLIRSGDIKGRVDSQNKILKARVTDVRAALFARAAQTGTRMAATNRKLLLRMRLQQADLVVKAPKSQLNASSGSSMIIDQLMDAT